MVEKYSVVQIKDMFYDNWNREKMNPYAKQYIESLDECQFYGEKAVKTQIFYIFSNLKAKTPQQRVVKRKLMAYARVPVSKESSKETYKKLDKYYKPSLIVGFNPETGEVGI